MSYYHKILILVTFLSVLVTLCMARKKSRKLRRGGLLRQKETNAVDFLRLVVMRLVYGVATRFGFGENISEALNGAFVPPGVDDYDDYGDFDLSDREDYDDY
ncbi:hypothetical protein ILUMI_22808 [Ignelater luminosus]|uniref:Uncharacterized protein n=1 Tax=Ignelater luminosus TaxID=2038154 RepID=A0A8K0G2I8_IGNLU|nr:hypothetical protein ILUMI_22808 [Ignelater luminosus]